MGAFLLASVLATGAEGVPGEVVERARALVEEVLVGVPGEVRLRLYRTRAEMEAAVKAVAPRTPADFAAFYHYRSRTIHAYMAPRPEPALFDEGLPGLLEGALVHEAFHARGALLDPGYRSRAPSDVEGEADRAAVAFLARRAPARPAPRSAWELLLESRRWRLETSDGAREGRALAPLAPPPHPPDGPGERSAWYALAYAGPGAPVPDLAWVLFEGSAEPRDGAYRLVAAPGAPALLVAGRHDTALEVDVTPLRAGKGQVELLFDFESRETHAKAAFLRRGGVRAMWRERGRWTKDSVHPAPPLEAGRTYRLSLHDGAVAVDGRTVLFVQMGRQTGRQMGRSGGRGRVGVGVWDGALDLRPLR